MQIIVAATRDAAYVCRREGELGTLEVGKLADVLVVDGNPLENLQALADVRPVVHEGVIVRAEGVEGGDEYRCGFEAVLLKTDSKGEVNEQAYEQKPDFLIDNRIVPDGMRRVFRFGTCPARCTTSRRRRLG